MGGTGLGFPCHACHHALPACPLFPFFLPFTTSLTSHTHMPYMHMCMPLAIALLPAPALPHHTHLPPHIPATHTPATSLCMPLHCLQLSHTSWHTSPAHSASCAAGFTCNALRPAGGTSFGARYASYPLPSTLPSVGLARAWRTVRHAPRILHHLKRGPVFCRGNILRRLYTPLLYRTPCPDVADGTRFCSFSVAWNRSVDVLLTYFAVPRLPAQRRCFTVSARRASPLRTRTRWLCAPTPSVRP